jgi:hypothetical protein
MTSAGFSDDSVATSTSSPGVSAHTPIYTPEGTAALAKMPMVTCEPAATTTSDDVAAV